MQKLALALSLAFALVGTVRLVNPNAGAAPCNGVGCLTRLWSPA